MEPREALYYYSWHQSPLHKRKDRVVTPAEEKQIFDHWFEETADDYFQWTKNQGLDDEIIRANASWTLSMPPYEPDMQRVLLSRSPQSLEKLRKRKKDPKEVEEEEKARKEAEKQAMWNRYMDKMRVARREIEKIKEKRRKRANSNTQVESVRKPAVRKVCRALSDLSPFQKKISKGPPTIIKIRDVVKKDKRLERETPVQAKVPSTSAAYSQGRRGVSSLTGTNSAKSKLRVYPPRNDEDEDSDAELLRIALESSPDPEPKLRKNTAATEDDELSDDALLALATTPPKLTSKPNRESSSLRSPQMSFESGLKVIKKERSPQRNIKTFTGTDARRRTLPRL